MNKVGKYEILEEIGRGGFATVYKARDTTLDRIVALKILHADIAGDPRFIKRFYKEARAAAQLRHPNIATVYEVGEETGQHYLAMTFLSGQTLDAVLKSAGEPLPLEQTGLRAATRQQRLQVLQDHAGSAWCLSGPGRHPAAGKVTLGENHQVQKK